MVKNAAAWLAATLLWASVEAGADVSSTRERRVVLEAPLVGVVAVSWMGTPGLALAEGGKDLSGRVLFVADAVGPQGLAVELVELARDLVGLDSIVALDVDRDGVAETLLAGHPGGVWRIGGQSTDKVLDGDGINLHSVRRGATLSHELVLAQSGRLDWYQLVGGELKRERKVVTPQRLRPSPWGLELEGAPVALLTEASAELVVGPLERGSGRLETTLIGADGSQRTAWSLLPSGFHVSASRALVLAGRPLLLVSGATKLGVFVDAEVLVFSLGEDPSGRGFGPIARFETPCAFWNPPQLERRLVGEREELVATCPKGVTGGDLWVSAWEVGVGGRPRAPRSGDLDLDSVARSAAGDLDGDGVGDLLVLGQDGVVSWFAGRERGRPVEKRAAATWRLREAAEREVTEISVTVGDGAAATKDESGAWRVVLLQPKPGVVVAARSQEPNGGEVLILRFRD